MSSKIKRPIHEAQILVALEAAAGRCDLPLSPGTLFLDEVDTLGLEFLLRLVSERDHHQGLKFSRLQAGIFQVRSQDILVACALFMSWL